MTAQKCSEGLDCSAITGKDNQRRPKPSEPILPLNVNNVKRLLSDFDDAWRSYRKGEHGVGNLLGFLAWLHEELEAAGAFGEAGS